MNEVSENTQQVESPLDRVVICPACKREWPWQSEQATCVDMYGACIACNFIFEDPVILGDNDILAMNSTLIAIRDKANKRKGI